MDKKAVQEHAVFLSLLVIAIHMVLSSSTSSSWWTISVSELSKPTTVVEAVDCLNSSILATSYQRDVCRSDKNILLAIARGTKQAIIQCQDKFGNRRWNCTTFVGEYFFGKFITTATRESAAVYAYMSAGAAYGLAVACRTQSIPNCRCEVVGDVRYEDLEGNIILNDCSDNIEYASKTLSEFLKENSSTQNDIDLVNAHNYAVGIEVLKQRNTTCLCHGLSGTCTVQTCYQKIPDVAEFGAILRRKYDKAIQVNINRSSGTSILVPVEMTRTLNQQEFAYLRDSPDFCTSDNATGVLGTVGRKCDPNSEGADGCFNMCCGRGYTIRSITVPQECCQFVWCCRIECTYCRNLTITENYCR